MKKNTDNKEFIELNYKIQFLLAIELWRSGLSQAEIGKRLEISTGSVNKMLKGVSKEIIVINNSN